MCRSHKHLKIKTPRNLTCWTVFWMKQVNPMTSWQNTMCSPCCLIWDGQGSTRRVLGAKFLFKTSCSEFARLQSTGVCCFSLVDCSSFWLFLCRYVSKYFWVLIVLKKVWMLLLIWCFKRVAHLFVKHVPFETKGIMEKTLCLAFYWDSLLRDDWAPTAARKLGQLGHCLWKSDNKTQE